MAKDVPEAAADAASPAILARALTKHFGEVVAVDAVDLDVARGTLMGLLGPDGAGKSTLIRLFSTVLAPTSGDAFVLGHSVVSDPWRAKAGIGYMSQRFSLYGDLTVMENLEFFAQLRGVGVTARRARATELLDFAGLTGFEQRQARFLSGGMKQKLALAATLIHEPDVLLLDEPTTGVDPVSRREFWRIISGLHRRGKTIFVATPYMDEAERCETVALMQGGRIMAADTPQAIQERVPGTLVEVGVSDQRAAAAALEGLPFIQSVDLYGDQLEVLVSRGPDRIAEVTAALAAAGQEPRYVREGRVTMEVAFSQLEGRE